MSYINDDEIKEYYRLLGLEPIFPHSIFDLLSAIGKRKKGIIVSDNRMYRAAGKLYHMLRISRSSILSNVEDHFAFIDALKILAKKNVPIYFYNRVGLEKNGFVYSDLAKQRMQDVLNFPTMVDKPLLYKKHLDELLGENNNKDYIDDLQKIPQVVKKGNIYSHEDAIGRLVNVANGKRVTLFTPETTERRLHVYGRCGAFGYAVSDEQNLPSQMQKLLRERNIEVINHGIWGGEDKYILHNFFNEIAGFNENDIVVFYMMHFDKRIQGLYEELGMRYMEITEKWHQYDEAKWCFYDRPGHMNAVGYKNAAKIIVDDLVEKNFAKKNVENRLIEQLDAKYLNSYLKEHKDNQFEKEVSDYIDKIIQDTPVLPEDSNVGSIVMNCNPFTNGHRYLIEYAAKQVDRLYIFVVEEDRSLFKFADRFEMVKKATSDIDNVVVVPSGNFIISTLTFPEYFLKDYVKEKNFDVSQDLETFCSLIAKPLNIKVRFAGQEPFDPVTKNYNENMERILPQYGMKFVEIPRLKIEGSEEQINATKVRSLMKEKKVEELRKYVPNTTLEIIIERYL